MEKSIVCRLKKGKKQFEILTHHGAVEKWREGKLAWSEVCTVDAIFKNAHKGDRLTDAELIEAFETSETEKCLQIIATKGEVQSTASDRQKAAEDKRKEVVNYLAKYYIDPKTKKPYTLATIDNALTAAKIRIDLDTPVDLQVKAAYPKLLEFIKLKRSEIEGRLQIPHAVLAQSQAVVRRFCQIQSENYTSEGVVMQIGVVPGDFDKFMADLSSATKGDYTFDVDGLDPTAEAAEPGKGKNKHGGGGGGKGKGGGGKKR